jgi:alpha-mannosidase
MHDDRSHVEARIRRLLAERITPAVHGAGSPLRVSAHHVAGDPIGVGAARAAPFAPFAVGDPWGTPWGTTWFRLEGEVPAAWEGQRVEALIAFAPAGMPGFGAEALVWEGDAPRQGLHPQHQRIVVAEAARGGEAVDLLVEAAANPDFSTSFAPNPFGDPSTAPSALLYRLARAELAPLHRAVHDLDVDLRVLANLMAALAADEPRRHEILRAIERALDALDLADVPGSAAAARQHLAPVLARPAAPSAHLISAVGHAHIDTAWLWPVREARRKCTRTFSTALALMDEYPEFRFACSQAQQYAWVRDEHPALFARIRDKVTAGQWVPVGGMWVEADANLTSGESLVRQFVHGQRFFAEELGVTCTEAWLPDVFGYSGALPQIMRGAGCTRFVTQKLSWNETNAFPHHTFWWEGIDGSRVLTHFPPADTYNGEMKPAELLGASRRFREHGRSRRSLYLFGHGDGGGGPTRDMLERARRVRDLEGLPRLAIEAPSAFFDAVGEEPDHPVWVGELYLEKHRGTFTTQAHTKAGNRRAEHALREAELWASAAAGLGAAYPQGDLDRAWRTLLTQQFHDILPGSGITWVHRDAEIALGEARTAAESVIARSLAVVADGMVPGLALANSLTHDRAEVVVLGAGDGDPLTHHEHTQRLVDGRTAAFVRLPGAGVATARPLPPPDTVVAGDQMLEHGSLRIEWDAHGVLTSVYDKEAGREVLAGPGNVLQLFADHPVEFDAWDIDRTTLRLPREVVDADSVTLLDGGPLVGRLRVERSFGASRIVQDVVLRAGSRRIDVVTRVDWREEERLLKVAFPVDVRASRARYEIQFGWVDRPTHDNTSWDWAQFEVCGHTWADLAEPGYGVALLSDAKYGYDVRGGVMRLTLLRAPRYPDPAADRGHHEFTYSLLPHVGDLRDGDVVAEAHQLNAPVRPLVVRGGGAVEQRRVVTVDHPGVVLSAVKRADDGSGDWVLRAYEAWGQRSRVRIALEAPIVAAQRCDLLEQPERGVEHDGHGVALELRPFELVTLRLTPGAVPAAQEGAGPAG